MFCDVIVCYKQMTVVEKAMHTTSQLILQAIDVVTFDFKGTHVRCFSAALLIIKWITLRCKSFLNVQSL